MNRRHQLYNCPEGHRVRRGRVLCHGGTVKTGRFLDPKFKSEAHLSKFHPTRLKPTQPEFNLAQFISFQFSPNPTQ